MEQSTANEKSMKELMDHNKGSDGWKNRIQKKELLDDSDCDITEFDPLSTFCEANTTAVPMDNNPGIKKNAVPVFRTKGMGMTKSSGRHINLPNSINLPTNNTVPNLPTYNHENKENALNSLVTKVPFTNSHKAPHKHLAYNDDSEHLGECDEMDDLPEEDGYMMSDKQQQYLNEIADLSTDNEIHKLHMIQSLQALQYLKGITIPPKTAIRDKIIYLPPPRSQNHKKTLIFDMDETLIHCVDDIDQEDPQFIIKVPLDGEEVEAGINVRPYALECLEA